MEIFQSITLGIIQGIGEFLPISSTAHLAIIPYFFNFPDPGLSFDVALHFGTLLAVAFYFRKDWMVIISNLKFLIPKQFQKTNNKIEKNNYNKNFLWLIVVATIPGALAGYFLESKAETVFRSPLVIAFTLSSVGLILYLSDKYLKHRKNIQELTLKNAIMIGIFQAIAIIPGVSRSGATIIGGLGSGLNRSDAARFSFLLSTPIILGAVVNQFSDFFQGGINLGVVMGIIFSFLSGYLAIGLLLKFIEKVSYKVFFWYRLALAIIIVIFYFS